MSQQPNSSDNRGQLEQSLENLLPDYINGHLDSETTQQLESALADNADLRAQLEFQSRLQIALRADAEVADSKAQSIGVPRGSGFAAIADRLEESSLDRLLNRLAGWFGLTGVESTGGLGLSAVVPAFALMLVVGLVASTNLQEDDVTINEFRTIIGEQSYDQPTLIILLEREMESLAFAELLDDYGLQLAQQLPESNMAEVTLLSELSELSDHTDMVALTEALMQDERVAFAKIVSDLETSDAVSKESVSP